MHFLAICISLYHNRLHLHTSNSNYLLFTKVDKSHISGTCQVHQLSLSCAVMDLYLHRSGLCLHDLPCYSTPVGCALAISRPCPTSDKYETDPPPHNTLRSHTHRSHSKWGKGFFRRGFYRREFYWKGILLEGDFIAMCILHSD